jgi:predicted AAA+ superfamily ATPase
LRKIPSQHADYVDLMSSRVFLDLNHDPSQLESYISHKHVIIDEIQRIPALLNEVHRLIETRQLHFLMTGSSARKLRRSGVNLLAGRAYKAELFGLSWREICDDGVFDLGRYLLYGGLPDAYLKDDADDYLYAYTDTYLREEIQAEALVKNLSNYNRFLLTAARPHVCRDAVA